MTFFQAEIIQVTLLKYVYSLLLNAVFYLLKLLITISSFLFILIFKIVSNILKKQSFRCKLIRLGLSRQRNRFLICIISSHFQYLIILKSEVLILKLNNLIDFIIFTYFIPTYKWRLNILSSHQHNISNVKQINPVEFIVFVFCSCPISVDTL